jgi:hypothetical protein
MFLEEAPGLQAVAGAEEFIAGTKAEPVEVQDVRIIVGDKNLER